VDDGVEAAAGEEAVEGGGVVEVEDVEAALGDVVGVAFGEVVHDLDIVPFREQMVGGVGADVAGAAGDEDASHRKKGRPGRDAAVGAGIHEPTLLR